MKIKLHYPNPGMTLHGENLCKYHNFEKYDYKTDRDKPAVFWLYFDDDYKALANHKGPKYVFWLGTDVLHLANNYAKQYISVVRDPSIKHICMNSLLRDELAHMGIYAEVKHLFWGDISKYPKEDHFTKDCYMSANQGRGIEYGEAILNTLAWRYPSWNFHVFGIEPTIPVYCDNVKYYGQIPEEEMDQITKNFGLCFRWNKHDGFSQTIAKALMRGQDVITTIPYEGLTHFCRNMSDVYQVFEKRKSIFDFFKKKPDPKQFVNFDFINEYQPDHILS